MQASWILWYVAVDMYMCQCVCVCVCMYYVCILHACKAFSINSVVFIIDIDVHLCKHYMISHTLMWCVASVWLIGSPIRYQGRYDRISFSMLPPKHH